MNLADLRVFVSAARHPSLAAAAIDLHLTPSAISKALRRLEENLGTVLFDRSARQLVLNDGGRRLLHRAQTLLALAEQARVDVLGERAEIDCRLGGPALLLWRHADMAREALGAYQGAALHLQALFEDEALAALARADLHAAIVTGEALANRATEPDWEAAPLGQLDLQLMAGRAHPLAAGKRANVIKVRSARLLEYDFACPPRSLFCGVQRGARSDGWRDEKVPRRIRYWTDDLQLLLGFVRSGQALAYLPDFAQAAEKLVRIDVSDQVMACSEQVYLVFNRATASQWLLAMAARMGQGKA